MNTQRTDFLVGLLILVSVGIIIGAFLVTSGFGVVRHEFYVRVASAEDLSTDTRVELQGLGVGRVRQVNPVVDSTNGTISFVARIAVQDRFPNGTKLALPRGTEAVISQATPIAPSVIHLVLPAATPGGSYLAPGDTINSQRPQNVLESLGKLATDLSGDVSETLRETRVLAERTTSAVRDAQTLMRENAPALHATLAKLSETLDRTQALLAEVEPRIGPLQDSVTTTLADTRRLVQHMDSLVTTASSITAENRDVIRETAGRLLRSTEVLEHFADQVSRRPTRLLTGVTPPTDDSSRKVP